MKKLITSIVAVAVLFTFSVSANAQVTASKAIQTDNSAGGTALDGFVTNDILVSFNGQWTGSQMIIDLTEGNIYQDGFGGVLPPNNQVIGLVPSAEFDTMVTQGAPTSDGTFGAPAAGGGAIDLGGSASPVFTTAAIDQSWNPPGGVTIVDQTQFLVARVTLSETAQGTAKWLASAAGIISTFERPIIDGVIVPEPTTMVMAGLGLVGVVCTRRRRS